MKLVKPLSHVISALLMAGAVSSILPGCKPTPKNETGTNGATTTPGGTAQFADSAGSYVKVYDENGRVCVQRTNTFYELVTAYQGDTKLPLLLKITRVDLCYADSVNKHKVYTVEAKSVGDSKAVNWKADFVATDLEFKDNAMLAVHEGVDNEEDYFKMFSLVDGHPAMDYSYGSVKVSIPNVDGKHFRRFAGFTSQLAAGAPLKELKQENVLGTVQYGSSAQIISRATLTLKRGRAAEKMQKTTPDMVFVPLNENNTVMEEGKTLVLMKAPEKYQTSDIKDFAAQLTFYFGDDNEATIITIPVVNDKFDFEHAKYDKDIFELRPN